MDFAQASCTEFVTVLASNAPVPGGGGATPPGGGRGPPPGDNVGGRPGGAWPAPILQS